MKRSSKYVRVCRCVFVTSLPLLLSPKKEEKLKMRRVCGLQGEFYNQYRHIHVGPKCIQAFMQCTMYGTEVHAFSHIHYVDLENACTYMYMKLESKVIFWSCQGYSPPNFSMIHQKISAGNLHHLSRASAIAIPECVSPFTCTPYTWLCYPYHPPPPLPSLPLGANGIFKVKMDSIQ